MCKASLTAFIIFSALCVGREMQNVMPLKFHPKISFSVNHAPSPLAIFLLVLNPLLCDLTCGEAQKLCGLRLKYT